MKTNENFQLSTFNFQPDKRLAVVILNWNGRALMEEFLPSVVACTPGEWADVIVADNGSTDDSIEMLKTKFPTVGIIRLDKNYGFAEGYNQALKHIGHEYTVLLNSDVEVTPGKAGRMISAALQFVGIIFFVLMILGVANAASGKVKELPFIGRIRLLK